MTFLSPVAAILAAAAIPLLLLLYFLKLRRRTVRIGSTLLWEKSTEDLQANTPFQRLRVSMLLLLQLLLVLLLIGALARPVLLTRAGAVARVILLIDASASMSAVDGNVTRLDEAKLAAREIVARLGRRSEGGEVMVVAFARTARVVSGFESNQQLLLAAIDAIEPTDEEADLEEALDLASAFARHDDSAAEFEGTLPEVVLLSDGGVAPPENTVGFLLRAGNLRFVGIGPAPKAVRNAGIGAFSARPDYDDPARQLVFARMVNAGPNAVETTATLRADGEPVAVKQVTLPAAAQGPGEAPLTFSLELPRGALLTLSLPPTDDLASDDTAALVVPPPLAARVAVVVPVGGPDPFLFGLLEALEPARLLAVRAPEGENDVGLSPEMAQEFDLIVYDRVAPRRLTGVPSLVIGATPPGFVVHPPTRSGGRRIASWDRQHPLLRHVSLDSLVFSGFGRFELPPGASALAFGPDGPVMAVVPTRGARHVVVGFSLSESNWPVDVGIAVFLQNVLDFLTLAGNRGTAASARPGEPIVVRSLADAFQIVIEGPLSSTLDVVPGTEVTLPPLSRVGLYELRGAAPPDQRLAVNLQSDVESDIRPRRTVVVNALEEEAGAVGDAVPRELWPVLAAAAIGLLALEWVVYCLRLRR